MLNNRTLPSNLRVVPLSDEETHNEDVLSYFLIAAILIFLVCITFFLTSSGEPSQGYHKRIQAYPGHLIVMDHDELDHSTEVID